jgi:hypothetical protein
MRAGIPYFSLDSSGSQTKTIAQVFPPSSRFPHGPGDGFEIRPVEGIMERPLLKCGGHQQP